MDDVQDLTFGFLDEADLPQLCQLEKALNPSPWEAANFMSSFHSGHACLGLRNGKDVIAYCIFSEVADEAELLLLAVSTAWQGQGLGKKLVKHGLNALAAKGKQTCFLEVRESNAKAIALYESLGFNCVGQRKNYYPGLQKAANAERENALIFAIELACFD